MQRLFWKLVLKLGMSCHSQITQEWLRWLLLYNHLVLFKVMQTSGSSALVDACPGLANNFIYVVKAICLQLA